MIVTARPELCARWDLTFRYAPVTVGSACRDNHRRYSKDASLPFQKRAARTSHLL